MPAEEVKVSPFDHGFLYGLGLFETFRTYDGHPFLLDDHMARLRNSAQVMNIKLADYDREQTDHLIRELLRLNNLSDGYFRWNVSAGERGIGLSTSEYGNPNTMVYVKSLPEKQLASKVAQTLSLRRNTAEGPQRLKSHHYLNNILGKRELGEMQNKEGIFLTEDGFLSEGVVSNLFWYKKGTLYTPDLTCGCLDGITRQLVMRIASKANIPIEVGRFSLKEAKEAEEVFVTNSIQEVIPIKKWDETSYSGEEGSFVQWLKGQYNLYVPSLWSKSEL